jgi:hypothetical protein
MVYDSYTIRVIKLQLFKSYLEDRYQRTLFNESCSEEAETNLSVPQGSAIGPLLFILYIYDLEIVTVLLDKSPVTLNQYSQNSNGY